MLDFLNLLITKSNFRSEPLDLNAWRVESLEGINHLLPDHAHSTIKAKRFGNTPFLFNLLATGAYLKNSMRFPAQHLVAAEQKLFYVRIPKAASTSIAHEMLGLINPEIKKETLSNVQTNFLADSWSRKGIHSVKDFEGFTIVRHPLTRLVSVYRDIFEREGDPFIYQNYLGGILTKNLSFEEFISRINRIPDWLKDQHFKPQYLFLKPYKKQKLLRHVFKLEKPELINGFMARYGLEFQHLNKSSGYNYMDYYTQASLRIAKKMYIHDFELFSYEHK